jgi:hypothetical protein
MDSKIIGGNLYNHRLPSLINTDGKIGIIGKLRSAAIVVHIFPPAAQRPKLEQPTLCALGVLCGQIVFG